MAILSSGFNLVKAILVAVICLSIIGSIAQLVAALFALASAQDVKDAREQSNKDETHHPVIMLIMALVCFTFELIGIIAVFRKSLSVLSVFGLVMCLATIISCFTGYGGLKLLIILLNMTMTSLSAVYIYLIMRKKEMEAFRQRNSMSISVINDMSNNHHNNRKISQQS